MCTDDLRFIGLVTSRRFDADTVSNSCHVFMTEVDLSLEEIRKRARAFQIEISPSHQEDGSENKEFRCAKYVISIVQCDVASK